MSEETMVEPAAHEARRDVEDAAPVPAPDGDRPAGARKARSRRLSVREIAGLVVIAALAVALVVTLAQSNGDNGDSGARGSAVAAARSYATDVSTYSYLHLHRDFGRVEAESTPSFRRTFSLSSGSLAKVLVQYKAVATSTVLSAGVVSIDSTRAVVMLFVNQTVHNTAQQGPTTDDSRILVTLRRGNGRWMLQDLKLL
jgi:Mce-associated membrane protein